MDRKKPVIYQLFPRLFTNTNPNCVPNGTLAQNGVGKMNDITDKVLQSIRDLGVTSVWYTGVIEHATKTYYTDTGIVPADNPY
ncbi:MAG: alpha-amylase, partial [Duncaniella sp.]|nr:alpha-amylase [Duncaniella sp.]